MNRATAFYSRSEVIAYELNNTVTPVIIAIVIHTMLVTYTKLRLCQKNYKKNIIIRMCTLWRCNSTPTRKAKLLWMTSHYGPTTVRSATETFHVFI